jgi:hypothetical protein
MLRKTVMALGLAAMVVGGPAMARDKEPEQQKVMPNGEPIICQKSNDTGSLVKKTKRCYTKAQWERIALAGRANATRIASDHTGTGDLSN